MQKSHRATNPEIIRLMTSKTLRKRELLIGRQEKGRRTHAQSRAGSGPWSFCGGVRAGRDPGTRVRDELKKELWLFLIEDRIGERSKIGLRF